MRGKLRDKSSINRRGALRRTDGEQRQPPYKRDARGMQWIGEPQEDDDDAYGFEEALELDEEENLASELAPLKETQKNK
jgi:hypothetical protein